MMPLTLANIGEENIIKKINGTPQQKQPLSDMGFVVGGKVTAVSDLNGSLIVNVKESRVAIGKSMAMKIMI